VYVTTSVSVVLDAKTRLKPEVPGLHMLKFK